MDQETLKKLLMELLSSPTETEWLEFKSAGETMPLDEIGKYFSALSNEANIKRKDRAWLVLGVNNAKQITGTNFKNSVSSLNDVKKAISDGTGGSSFIEIHQYIDERDKRVLLFEIAPAPQGVLVKWKGMDYGREGESLKQLGEAKRSVILSQDQNDWSGRKCAGSSLNDLDQDATNFLKEKLSEAMDDVSYSSITDQELLDRLALLQDGVPVNTAILLLGKTESAARLLVDKAKVTWKYTDEDNDVEERITFDAPLLPKLESILSAVNRFNVHLQEDTLFRKDVTQYDKLALRELLVNAIAHRDWSISLWVEVKQTPAQIAFVNPGMFRADVNAAIERNERPPYLNKKLADILQRLKLMEREGGGLRKVYKAQLGRGARVIFNINESANPSVEFVLRGKVEDVEFAQIVLSSANEISISNLLSLDKIRSGNNKVGVDISPDKVASLKEAGYIETRGGKHQRVFLSASFSQTVGMESEYTTSKSLPREAKIAVLLKHLEEFGKITSSQATKMFKGEAASTTRKFISSLVMDEVLSRVMPTTSRTSWYYVKYKKGKR